MAEKENTCRICLKPFNAYSMGEKNDYKLVACRSCGSVMVLPWLTPADLEKFFGDVQPSIVHSPDPQASISGMKKMIQKVTENYAGRRFLDVSCRQGYAVMAAKELGFQQARGIDPHDFFISFAKDKYDGTATATNISFTNKDLTGNRDTIVLEAGADSTSDSHPAGMFEHISVPEFAARGEQAEVVFSIESFCEQPDPDGYMAGLSKLIAPGGLLYLQEPDGNSIHLPRIFTRWRFADPPLNFVYLSEKGMESLLARHKLKVQKKFFTWAPFMRWVIVKK